MILCPELLERSQKIRANPYTRAGMRLEDAVMFCDEVDHAMNALTPDQQRILWEYAAGFRLAAIAARLGMTRRTLARKIHEMRQREDVMLPGRAA